MEINNALSRTHDWMRNDSCPRCNILIECNGREWIIWWIQLKLALKTPNNFAFTHIRRCSLFTYSQFICLIVERRLLFFSFHFDIAINLCFKEKKGNLTISGQCVKQYVFKLWKMLKIYKREKPIRNREKRNFFSCFKQFGKAISGPNAVRTRAMKASPCRGYYRQIISPWMHTHTTTITFGYKMALFLFLLDDSQNRDRNLIRWLMVGCART